MVAPPGLIERFETAKQSTELTSVILDQRIVCEALIAGWGSAAPTLRAV